MASPEEKWLKTRIDKLEKRLRHHRDLGKTLLPSIIQTMNDRAIIDMELKLWTLRRQAGAMAS